MREKIQLICLGFGLGLTVFAVTLAGSTVEPVVEQRQSIFDVSNQPETEREEVIESDSGDSEAESSEPKSLPLDPQQVEPTTVTTNAVQSVLPAASLSDEFASTREFFESGDNSRLVVLTAPAWCPPCKVYEPILNRFHASESFNAPVQVIDIDKHQALYRLLDRHGQVPQTLWMSNGQVKSVIGSQSAQWLQAKTGFNPEPLQATKENVKQQMFWCTTHQRWETRLVKETS